MDFFAAQERAQRNSRWLIVLFIIAVFMIISLFYFAVVIFQGSTSLRGIHDAYIWWQPDLFIAITTIVSLFVLAMSLFKIYQLSRNGGGDIARSLGGERVERDSIKPLERRLLNIVDEMAIASSLPVPDVYILKKEKGINAFAAGTQRNKAVIAVTEGTLRELNREELQGVIAHEFSHILNGDMTTNIRLIGVLHGIHVLALVGRKLLSGTRVRRGKNQSALPFIALGLMVIGYIGVFFSRLIKAAISRQREYLADASAVQFTRNPLGITGALKKIAGIHPSTIQNSQAEMVSHMFFESGIRFRFAWFLTHPPIEQRILRLDPSINPHIIEFLASQPKVTYQHSSTATLAFSPHGVSNSIGTLDELHLQYAHQLLDNFPPLLQAAINKPQSAMDVVLALLVLSNNPNPGQDSFNDKRMETYFNLLKGVISRNAWLAIVDIAMVSIKRASDDEIDTFIQQSTKLIRQDNRLTLFEYAVMCHVNYYLQERLQEQKETTNKSSIKADIYYLLSFLVQCDRNAKQNSQAAYSEAIKLAPVDGLVPKPSTEKLSFNKLDSVLKRLALLPFRFKGKIIEAAVAAICEDGRISINESELIRVIGLRFDCPIPPLIEKS